VSGIDDMQRRLGLEDVDQFRTDALKRWEARDRGILVDDRPRQIGQSTKMLLLGLVSIEAGYTVVVRGCNTSLSRRLADTLRRMAENLGMDPQAVCRRLPADVVLYDHTFAEYGGQS